MAEKYLLTKEECVSKGGHIWGDDFVSPETINYSGGIPFKNSPIHRTCKYCGHRQKGYCLPMIWEDD